MFAIEQSLAAVANPRQTEGTCFQTDVPNRLDRLPWSRWHWLVVTGLGVTWILDGLEVTLAGAVGAVLKSSLHMSDAAVGASATFYLIGAVLGAIGFGYATDRMGRKKLFHYAAGVFQCDRVFGPGVELLELCVVLVHYPVAPPVPPFSR